MSLRSFNLTQSPIVALLHPRERTGMVLWASALGLVAWGIAVWQVGLPHLGRGDHLFGHCAGPRRAEVAR